MQASEFTMDKYIEMLQKPFVSMWQDAPIVLMMAIPAHILLEVTTAVHELIDIEWKLAVGMMALIVIDLFTGIMASHKRGDKITSLKLRQTGIKVVEYTMVLLAVTVISNMADEIKFIQKFAFVFLAMIELKSIVENLSDENGIIKSLFEAIRKSLADRGQLPNS